MLILIPNHVYNTMKMNLRLEKDHSGQMQSMLRKDKDGLEQECEKLRMELMSAQAKV